MKSKTIAKLRDVSSVTRNRVMNLYTHCRRWVVEARQAVVAWVGMMSTECTRLISKVRGTISINGDIAKYGILFFTVFLILLAVEQPSENFIWWGSASLLKSIPPPTFCVTLRIALFIISFMFAAAIAKLYKMCKLANFLNGQLKWIARLIQISLLLFALWIIPPMLSVTQIITLVMSAIFIIAVFCRWLGNKLEKLLKEQLYLSYWFMFLFVYTISWLRGFSGISSDRLASKLAFWFGNAWFLVIVLIYLKAVGQIGKHE